MQFARAYESIVTGLSWGGGEGRCPMILLNYDLDTLLHLSQHGM